MQWVREHPILWDSKNKEFKMKEKKEQIWDDKAKEKGMDCKF